MEPPCTVESEDIVLFHQFSAIQAPADALRRLATRTANSDYELVAIIVRVQHEVGGNLGIASVSFLNGDARTVVITTINLNGCQWKLRPAAGG